MTGRSPEVRSCLDVPQASWELLLLPVLILTQIVSSICLGKIFVLFCFSFNLQWKHQAIVYFFLMVEKNKMLHEILPIRMTLHFQYHLSLLHSKYMDFQVANILKVQHNQEVCAFFGSYLLSGSFQQ